NPGEQRGEHGAFGGLRRDHRIHSCSPLAAPPAARHRRLDRAPRTGYKHLLSTLLNRSAPGRATMSDSIGELSRRSVLGLSALAGAGFLLSACDTGGGSQSSAQGTGEGKITALFMKQAGYSEDDIRAMTADFHSRYPKITV